MDGRASDSILTEECAGSETAINEDELRDATSRDGNRKVLIQLLGDISLNGSFCDPLHPAAISENITMLPDNWGQVSCESGTLSFDYRSAWSQNRVLELFRV
jgi:hypothetical protein